MGSIEIATDDLILQTPMFAPEATVSEQIYILFIFLYITPIMYLSYMRLGSIEEYILNTSANEVRYESSDDTVVDANLLYDYLKVFATLMLIFSIPDILYLFIKTGYIKVASTALFCVQLYYFFMILEYGVSIGGRWSRKYISNDRTDRTEANSETT